MKFSRPVRKPLILLLVKRGVFFLGTLCFLTAFLYALGTRQGFMDRTQILLLRLLAVLGMLLITGTVFGVLTQVVFSILYKKPAFPRDLAWFVFFALIGLIAAFGAAFILVLARGNSV
ncbi:MAG: hypothetical protein LBH73_02540 [Spirochaetaceae bacterium]|nr:hypothetical protein [Spirochaetaceae bacterium]